MYRMRLSEDYLPVYVDLNPVRRMSKVVAKLAIVQKANKEIALIERQLEAGIGSLTTQDLELAKSELVRFAKIIAKNSRQGAKMLKILREDVKGYRKEIINTIG